LEIGRVGQWKTIRARPGRENLDKHPEDDAHWRHWDVQDPDGGNQDRYPDNSLKPRPNQKKLPKDRCEKDPNGDKSEWKSSSRQPMSVPGLPFIPLPLVLPAVPSFPLMFPWALPVPAFVFP
jgi:hypothetical protein